MESRVSRIFTFAGPTTLSAEKLQQLETLLTSILAMPAAQDTYAHLIDRTSPAVNHTRVMELGSNTKKS